MKAHPAPLFQKVAMTLVELLAVVAILAILIVASSTALTNVKRSAELKTSAAQVFDALATARQSAITLNASTEVRIYSQNGRYFLKLFRIAQNGAVGEQIDRIVRLPESVVFSTNSTWSTLLTDAITGPEASDSFGTYRRFRFKPNGTTNLGGTAPATITLIYKNDSENSSFPANFFTLQIDLQTGSVTTFRPS